MATDNSHTIKDTENFILNVNNLLSVRKIDLSRIKREHEIACKKIREFCIVLREKIENIEQKNLNEVNQHIQPRIQKIESEIEYLELVRLKAGDFLRRVNKSDGENENEISQYVDDVQQLVVDAEVEIQKIKNSQKGENIHLIVNGNKEYLIKSLVSLDSVLNVCACTTRCSGRCILTSTCPKANTGTSVCSDAHIERSIRPDAHLEVSPCSDAHTKKPVCSNYHKETSACFDVQIGKSVCADAQTEKSVCSDAHTKKSVCPDTQTEKSVCSDAHIEKSVCPDAHIERSEYVAVHIGTSKCSHDHIIKSVGYDYNSAIFKSCNDHLVTPQNSKTGTKTSACFDAHIETSEYVDACMGTSKYFDEHITKSVSSNSNIAMFKFCDDNLATPENCDANKETSECCDAHKESSACCDAHTERSVCCDPHTERSACCDAHTERSVCCDAHKETTYVTTFESSDAQIATSVCSDAHIATSEYTNDHIYTSACSDACKSTDKCLNTSITVAESNNDHKSTHESIYAEKSTVECSDGGKASADFSDIRITTSEYSPDFRGTNFSHSTRESADARILYVSPSVNGQQDLLQLSSSDEYDNKTNKKNIHFANTTTTGHLDLYDTLPCRKDAPTKCTNTSICLSDRNNETNIYDNVSVSQSKLANPCISNTSLLIYSRTNEDNAFYDADLFKQNQLCETDNPYMFSNISLPVDISSPPSSDISNSNKINKWHKPVPIMRFNVKENLDDHDSNIFDMCQHLDGTLLLIDNKNKKLKRFDQSYKLRDSLYMPDDPYCVCTAGQAMVAVSLRGGRKIEFVRTKKKMKVEKSFRTGNYCRGMAYVDGYLNVCTGDINDPFSGRIEVYNNNGKLQYFIKKDNIRLPTVIKYIAVTEVGQNRYVSTYCSDTIKLLNVAGTDESFRHELLKQPEGICTDGKGDIFVCGYHSNNIFRISPQRQQFEEILNENDGILKPIAICYDATQSRLLISCSHINEVWIFKVK